MSSRSQGMGRAGEVCEVLRAVLGPWRSYTNALICRNQHRPSLQLIPQFRVGVFGKRFPHGESDGIVPEPAAFAAGHRLAFWS